MNSTNISASELGINTLEQLKPKAKETDKQLWQLLLPFESKGFRAEPRRDFFHMLPTNPDAFQFDMPEVGLKIHVALDWQDPEYLVVIEHIAEVCAKTNLLDEITQYKIMRPTQQSEVPATDSQRYKGVVIYPNYVSDAPDTTNVSETVRLVSELQPFLAQYPYLSQRPIANELSVGTGLFI